MQPTYINQPGDYSGDTWHIAVVLALNDAAEVIQTISPKVKNSEQRSLQARALSIELGFSKRVHVAFTETDLYEDLTEGSNEGKKEYLNRNESLAQNYLQAKFGGEKSNVNRIYKSTSIIMKALEIKGRTCTLNELKRKFAKDFEVNYPLAAKEIQKLIKEIPDQSIAVNARFANYKKENNLNGEILNLIRESIRYQKEKIIIVGDITSEKFKAIEEAKDLKTIDLYNIHSSVNNVWGTKYVNMLGTTYFWSKLAGENKNLVVVGGRSGSLDAAAFMGNKTIAWDNLIEDDPESARHIIQAPLLLSIVKIAGESDNNKTRSRYRNRGGSIKEWTPKEVISNVVFRGEEYRPIYNSEKIREIILGGMNPRNKTEMIYE